MKSSFLIVADRGNLKAYRLEKAPADRPHRVHLIQAVSLADAHAKLADLHPKGQVRRTSDGSMQVGSTSGEQHYDIEDDRRSVKELAKLITDLLHEHKPDVWSFAAPSDLNHSILDHIEPSLRKQVAENIPRDLVNINANNLLDHFTQVRAA